MTEPEVLTWIKKYHRLTNYLSVSMLYLQDNFLLEEALKPDHIKERLLGHWGTVPGINLIYAGLNYLVSKTNQETLLVTGPGHGAPAILSNSLLEGTLHEFYSEYSVDVYGMRKLIKDFSWPGGFPSHTNPSVPGTIHEGGELGYSLGVAYGAAFDNPNLMVACIIGDGEAETGALAASWQSNKFLNPRSDGSILPILHLNGYKISGPTIFGSMSEEELMNYFKGLDYYPIYVDQYTSEDIYKDFILALNEAYRHITDLKTYWGTDDANEKPVWPVIILRTKKGWTMPEEILGKPMEDHNNSHGIPIKDPKNNVEEFNALMNWLESYKIKELLDSDNNPIDELFEFVPKGIKRIGMNRHAFGGQMKKELMLPNLDDHASPVIERGLVLDSSIVEMSEYLRDVVSLNEKDKNFLIFSPDESESNMLKPLFEVTGRKYLWPVRSHDEAFYKDGRVLEILSENTLQSWMQGYNLTGRHGILISYEAFLGIISSQIDQHIKYLKQSLNFPWRRPLPSINYIATSTTWRQDHNGFTHQNPVLINTMLSKHVDFVNVYFPVGTNVLLATLEEVFTSTNTVNLIVSDKRDLPEWLDMNEAREHVKNGISIWDWVGNVRTHSSKHDDVDVVLASAGDHQTKETLAAAHILKEDIPELHFQYVNINELTSLGFGENKKTPMSDEKMGRYFKKDKHIIFNFHGYPEVIKQLVFGSELANRITILGYIEEGTTTTPFDMQVVNGTSRYNVAIHAINHARKINPEVDKKAEELISKYQRILVKHKEYIREHGDDMPEVKDFKFKF